MSLSRITRRQILASGTLFAASPLLSSPAFAEEPKRGGTLVLGSTQQPRSLNGAVQSGVATALPSTQLFASPLRYDDKWNPQPYLAESWKLAEDGKSLTLHLRKNAVFHDGRPITSADVAFTIMAIKAYHPFKPMMAPVAGVDTPDAHTAVIRTSTPHPAILLCMSPALCPILPKHIYDDGQSLPTHPRNTANVIGSGPFRLIEFNTSQRIVIKRFDKFFLPGKPYLDKVIISLIPDTTSLVMGLERGDVQMTSFLNAPTDLNRLKKDPNIVLTSKGYAGIGSMNWLAFNLAREPMRDLQVRKAIATAIDKTFILKALMGGYSFPADGPIANDSPLAAADVVKYPYDLKKANAMLDAAGHKADANGVRFKVTMDYYPGNETQQKVVAEYMRPQLKKVGIEVTVRTSADFPSWAKRMASHDFDMSMDGTFNWGDPVIGVARAYMSTNIKPLVWTNTQSYHNPKVDELLDAAGSTLDPARRKADYAAFARIVTDELPVYVIDQTGYYTAASKKVGNVPASIWGTASPLDEVYLA